MLLNTSNVGLRLPQHGIAQKLLHLERKTSLVVLPPRRELCYRLALGTATTILRKKPDPPAAPPSSSSSSSPSFFTPSLCRVGKRHASNISSTSPADAHFRVLDWNAFFTLRTSRRRYSLASSIITSIVSTAATGMFIAERPELADEVAKLVPADPFISLGIATFGATLLGWLLGPLFGNTLWRLSHRAKLPEFTIKERAFFERIKRNRVNPSGASTNNPVPDYYGEKIGSVAGYRRWLKDQRAFNRKKEGTYNVT